MSEQFNQNYYDSEDENQEEIAEYVQKQEKQLEQEIDDEANQKDPEQDQKDKAENAAQEKEKDKDNVLEPKANIPIGLKKNLNEQDINIIKNSAADEDEENRIFWYCDNCKRGIQPKEVRFDCQICPDYTLCRKCNDAKIHNHRMKKVVVPANAVPPK